MPERVTETIVIFHHPFTLSDVGNQPAGTYRLTIEEGEVAGLSFLAYRRTATILHLPSLAVSNCTRESHVVQAVELENALDADRQKHQ